MSVRDDQREDEDTATSDSWLARLVAFVAWLLDSIARLKRIRRTTRFKPTWRDTWEGLRQLEWQRCQMLAQGAALLLSGRTLNDADYVPHPMPEDFGGPCPATPFEMNRRLLAVMTFIRDPVNHIRRYAQRIARRAGIALNGDPSVSRRRRRDPPPPLALQVREASPATARILPPSVAPRLGEVACAHLARMTEGVSRPTAPVRRPHLRTTAYCRLPIASNAPAFEIAPARLPASANLLY